MTQKRSFTYTTLRYVHDVQTGEFVNVGIVLYEPSLRKPIFRTRKTYRRVRATFPDLDGDAFRTAMAAVERALAHAWVHGFVSESNGPDRDALSFALYALPNDDSSLQWSPIASGVTDDPEKTLERLYARLVTRYDVITRARRTDEDVWRPVREKLTQRSIPVRLEEKVLVGRTDEISFSHAWKNGAWHAYEPISLDMADADGIKDKARRWRGHLAAVAEGETEQLKLSFIVGAPQDTSLLPAYRSAVAILKHSDFEPKIFEDGQVDELVNEIEDEFRAHMTDAR